jgi:hypothetical protein
MARKYNGQYRSTFTEANLVGAATVACIAGQYNKLGQYKVLSGDIIALGYSDLDDQCGAVGRIWVNINATGPAVAPGTIRLSLMSSADRQMSIEFECRTEILINNGTDRTKQLPFEVSENWLSIDKRFQLDFMPDANVTITKADTKILIDITKEAV